VAADHGRSAGADLWHYYLVLPDRTVRVRRKWLTAGECDWLAEDLERDENCKQEGARMSWLSALRKPRRAATVSGVFRGNGGRLRPGPVAAEDPAAIGEPGRGFRLPCLQRSRPWFSIPAMLMCGWHSDSSGERRWHAAAPRMAAAVVLAVGGVGDQQRAAGAGLVLHRVSGGSYPGTPRCGRFPAAFWEPRPAAASIGMINSFGNLGGFAGPYIIGWFSTRNGDYIPEGFGACRLRCFSQGYSRCWYAAPCRKIYC